MWKYVQKFVVKYISVREQDEVRHKRENSRQRGVASLLKECHEKPSPPCSGPDRGDRSILKQQRESYC